MAGKGNKNKNRQITSEKAYDILLDAVTKYDWQQKMTLSVPQIKLLFSKTPAKMHDTIQGATSQITNDDMEQMDIDDSKQEEEDTEELSLQDI